MMFILLVLFSFSSITFSDNRDRVLIVDSGISSEFVDKKYLCENGEFSFEENKNDEHGHGSNVYNLITNGIDTKKYCIISYKIAGKDGSIKGKEMDKRFNEAIEIVNNDKKIKYLNLSIQGTETGKDLDLIKIILDRGGSVTIAAGNNSINLNDKCDVFPACYKKVIKNNNLHVIGNTLISSNKGKVVTEIINGVRVGYPVFSGTSQSSAIKMNRILKN